MPQVFSVGVDEEVNSIIGKIRKATAKRVILVVAQRALILQSSVSLRLIKNEADALNKKVMIVTKDEEGFAIAKKLGFVTRKTLEEAGVSEYKQQESSDTIKQQEEGGISRKNISEDVLDKKNRLKNLGSDKFVSVSGIVRKSSGNNDQPKKNYFINNNKQNKRKLLFGNDRARENNFNDLFSNTKKSDNDVNGGNADKQNKKDRNKKFLFLVFLIFVFVTGFSFYLFFPKATVKITPQVIEKHIILTVDAEKDLSDKLSDFESDNIKIKANFIEKSDFLSLTYKATGKKSSSNQKARGTITIYNNFSEASQVLVATTRFLSEDGKLFRLIKTVVVPGMVIQNGEKKAGEIKAEVIADQAGEDFNIQPATFKIPGFEGSPKYDKFYAKSDEIMKGGGNGEDLRTVSEEDIEEARKNTERKLKENILKNMKADIGNDNILLDNAVKFEILDSAVFPEKESVADNFEYQIKIKAIGLYFSKNELNKELNEYIKEKILPKNYSSEIADINQKYEDVALDFNNQKLTMSLKVDVLLRSKIDKNNIKQELLGKGQRQIDALVGRHPEIKELEAEISPSLFANKIPKYSSRVNIEIVDN